MMNTKIRKAKCRITLDRLAKRLQVPIAIDTEFQDQETLTLQAAIRTSRRTVAVKVYTAPCVPPMPEGIDPASVFPGGESGYGRFFERAIISRPSPLEPKLSPARLLADLLRLPDVTLLDRTAGRRLIESGPEGGVPNAVWNEKTGRREVPTIRIVLVAHFLPADWGRAFGRDFYDDLLRPPPDCDGALQFRSGKLLGLAASPSRWGHSAPVVEYICDARGRLYRITLDTLDTALPFGRATLESHSRTFLDLGKSESMTVEDKRAMRNTFRRKPAEAYAYAMVDVVNTLLVAERMREEDRELYRAAGIDAANIPPMAPTLGRRVSNFLFEAVRKSSECSSGLHDPKRLKALMREGGSKWLGESCRASRFGPQSSGVHGGLNYSRSPTKPLHTAPGMLRDVDFSSCYATVLARMDVYWGRPIVHEPGRKSMSLLEAVTLASGLADPDGWMIRATGSLNGVDNALIPSTVDAVTSANFGKRKQIDRPSKRSRLYAEEIASGIVTAATWAMIRALPSAHRKKYEDLTADSIILYPRRFVADAASFDRLAAGLYDSRLPWSSELDIEARVSRNVEHLDHRYASLRYPARDLSRLLIDLRRQAQSEHGRGSGRDKVTKLQANSLYGVLASEHMAIFNVVAANQVTAAVRAAVFALLQSLNGFLVVTDGCPYRKDQVPACTLAECLEIRPDYLLRRAEDEDGIPFQDPATIPDEPAEFKEWYARNARRFFGVEGAEYQNFFESHDLVHKEEGGTTSFDALSCDGVSNYGKWAVDGGGGHRALTLSMRGFGRESRSELEGWIAEAYATGRPESLPPPTQDDDLLNLVEARAVARRAIRAGAKRVRLPLGFTRRRVKTFKPIKLSAFVCRTRAQERRLAAQIARFERRWGCGLEVLALRRAGKGGKKRSIEEILRLIYDHVREGRRDLGKLLHLHRLPAGAKAMAEGRRAEVERLREAAEKRLGWMIAVGARDVLPVEGDFYSSADAHLLITPERGAQPK